MRPLHRPPLAARDLQRRPPSALLMSAFGPFCMFGERPLPSLAHVWHAGRGCEITADRIDPADWNDLYLLDDAAFRAIERREADGLRATAGTLLLPDRNPTFARSGGPFAYGLEDVRLIFLDDDGAPEGEPETRRLATVRGASPEARLTIDAFALNSPYFDNDARELRIPRADYLGMIDHRIFERTTAWRRAERSAELLRRVMDGYDEPVVISLLDQIRLTVNATGYWSVWATVLGGVLKEKEHLRRALSMPEDVVTGQIARLKGVLGADADRTHLGYGPHNAMPGTNMDWLD